MARMSQILLVAAAAIAAPVATADDHRGDVMPMLQMFDNFFARRIVPELNDKLPTLVVRHGLDPWPVAVDKPGLLVQDLQGLSSLYIENITVQSVNVSNSNSTVGLKVKGKFLRNVTARVTTHFNSTGEQVQADPSGMPPANQTVIASLQDLQIPDADLQAIIHTTDLRIMAMDLFGWVMSYYRHVDPVDATSQDSQEGQAHAADKQAPQILVETVIDLIRTELKGTAGVELYPSEPGQPDSDKPALYRLFDARFNRAMVPQLNEKLPAALKAAGLDPLQSALDRPDLKIQDVTGLTSLKVENVSVLSMNLSNSNSTAVLAINGNFGDDITAEVVPGDGAPVKTTMTGLRVANSQLVADMDTMKLEVLGLDLSELALAFQNMEMPPSVESAGMDQNVMQQALSDSMQEKLQQQLSQIKGVELYEDEDDSTEGPDSDNDDHEGADSDDDEAQSDDDQEGTDSDDDDHEGANAEDSGDQTAEHEDDENAMLPVFP